MSMAVAKGGGNDGYPEKEIDLDILGVYVNYCNFSRMSDFSVFRHARQCSCRLVSRGYDYDCCED